MTGRTYTIKGWSEERWVNPGRWDEQLVSDPTETPYVVPDGEWVAEGVTSRCVHHRLISQADSPITQVQLQGDSYGYIYLYHSSQPFGVVKYTNSKAGMMLGAARQIHRGELGFYGPQVEKLPQVREPKFLDRPGQNKANRKNFKRWVNLAELMRVTDLNQVEILNGYALFLDFKYDPYYPYYKEGGDIPVVQCADLKSAFENDLLREADLRGMQLKKVMQAAWSDSFDPTSWWIRFGAAQTVLRLLALGLKPHQDIFDACIPPSRYA